MQEQNEIKHKLYVTLSTTDENNDRSIELKELPCVGHRLHLFNGQEMKRYVVIRVIHHGSIITEHVAQANKTKTDGAILAITVMLDQI